MYSKKFRSALSALLAFVLVFTACFVLLPATAAEASTQSELNSLQAQRNSLKQQQSQLQSTISSLKSQQNSTIELKTALDAQNTLTLQQIQNLEEQIELHTSLIEQKTKEVEEAQENADRQREKYEVRVRNMEENGRYSYIEVLFGASSIGEFLSLIDDIGDIIKSDKALEKAYLKSVDDLKTVKAEYEDAKAGLEDKKDELSVLNAKLEKDIASAAQLISALQSDINAQSGKLSEIASQRDDVDAEIAVLTKKLAEEARQREQQQQSSGGSVIATGSLMWPSYTTYVSSPYGYRIHPIYGTYKFHGGVDIAASYGTAIWAADSGTVVTSLDGWNGGYGNYIIIDHGNGVQTRYAHMSSRAVSANQTVSKGQVIGYVGSTGASTGAHIHFEVWNNGSRVDPMSYFR